VGDYTTDWTEGIMHETCMKLTLVEQSLCNMQAAVLTTYKYDTDVITITTKLQLFLHS